ncbi:binding-protein-dependent transport system inner membrane component [Tumebacillus sp. BK434]|uniref:ABC transporter permease subunit n=1 Tax=Tumebacillus sp. BK434 TaxID=2512169 RepID=UPI00104B17CC|nr:ABC transporter permease subunit [Tumebacillus sp. BK434]TCP54638.1 binding-protein-dependent transport system inner membrane component [Tumebacillus sp. BK434]
MIIRFVKGCMLVVCVLAGIWLVSNLGYAIDAVAHDRVQVTLMPGATAEEIVARYPGLTLIQKEPGLIVGYPEAEEREYKRLLSMDRQIDLTLAVPKFPSFDWERYGMALKGSLDTYSQGKLGEITFQTEIYPRNEPLEKHLGAMVKRTFSYLIPAFVLAVAGGLLIVLLAVLLPRLGKVLDVLNRLLLSLPDFFLIVMIQYAAVMIDKKAGKTLIVALQFQDRTPFLIPLLGIAMLPGAILYGTLRLAFAREWQEAYVRTAYAKGLTRPMVVLSHLLRNTWEDLLAVLPRMVLVAVTSMVAAEVITWTFGLGGYAFAQGVVSVSSLPVTCAILAVFTLVTNGLIAWVRHRRAVAFKEGK